MLITEGYLILGGNVFIQEHSSSLVKVFQLTLTEVTARGMAYVNLAFEALLKQNPALGGSALLSSGLIATMIKSCAATYRTEKQCESMQVIEIYLTVFSRILLAVPTEIPTFLNLLKQCNFNFDQLVSFVCCFLFHCPQLFDINTRIIKFVFSFPLKRLICTSCSLSQTILSGKSSG